MLSEPILTTRIEDRRSIPLLYWRARRPLYAISSAPLGGGLGLRHWVVNATVPMSYHREDPAAHLAELAGQLDLRGPGVGLLTGVDVAEVVHRTDGGVQVWATVGLRLPVPAAAPAAGITPLPVTEAGPLPVTEAGPLPVTESGPLSATEGGAALAAVAGGGPLAGDERRQGEGSVAGGAPPAGPASAKRVGTVNIVAFLPVRLDDAALVNAVATATEAKTQAIWELGLPGTGTPTDAVTLLCPPDGPAAPYGGPRSTWGARLARAVHAAVLAGGAGPVLPWSEQPGPGRSHPGPQAGTG